MQAHTPTGVANRPGLSAIAVRIGTHGDFLASMLARLSSPDFPSLAGRAASGGLAAVPGLQTRDLDDYAIGLLDAFACCADVLTFYTERIATEAYLRTALERRSLVELARLLGYRLRPGKAAETWLAFTMETAPGAPDRLVLEPGVKVQSVPGPDEKPQTFETVEPLDARPAWNALVPRPTRPHVPQFGSTDCYLQGVDLSLKAGDPLLFVGAEVLADPSRENWDVRLIKSVDLDVDARRTHVTWDTPLGSVNPYVPPAKQPEVHVLRRKAAIFGHNAPDWPTMPTIIKKAYKSDATDDPKTWGADWPGFTVSPVAASVDLDTVYPQIVPKSWIVLARPDYVELYRVSKITETSRAAFAISAKITRVTLASTENYAEKFSGAAAVRQTSVYAASEPLFLAEAPETEAVAHGTVIVSGAVAALPADRTLLVTGADVATGERATEVVTLETAAAVAGGTRLTFKQDLVRRYARASVTILANVARATHGETVRQVLGSGDASRADQRFDLKQSPLTFVSAATESGAASTLEVRVEDVAWHERPTLFDAGPDDGAYVVRVNDDATALVQFGDGRRGARLPTGRENVRATYRKGLGAAGNVRAGQLSQLMSRPLGLKEVVNPRAAEGGVDPEPAAAARRNMPLGVRTLGRAVSLRDYEDFARAFTGVAKAQAVVLSLRSGRTIFITIGGDGATRPGPDHPTVTTLVSALRRSGDPYVAFEVRAFEPVSFRLGLSIKRHPDHLAEKVLAAVDAALRAAFSFDAREFGQPVSLSEIVAVAAAVPGVIGVDVDRLYRGTTPTRQDRLVAAAPHADATGRGVAAELLTLAGGPLDSLGEMP